MPDNSIDAVVTDPPYGLSNVNPQNMITALTAWVTGDDTHVPNSRGFMGNEWDSFVPPPAVWKECYRVLKPGGHMVVFAGSRTQDIMGLSIRLAGFEIRDQLAWIYGSGFPKSMDVSKAIDKGSGVNRQRQLEFTAWLRSTGITAAQIKQATGTDMASHYLTDRSQPAIPTAELFDKLRPLLPEVPERIEQLVAERTGVEWKDYAQREVTGRYKHWESGANYALTSYDGLRRDKAHSQEAQQWSGWGTALKPAIEPITLARKPLDGTVAHNVLEHGTGGLNIDGCRVPTSDRWRASGVKSPIGTTFHGSADGYLNVSVSSSHAAGRFPANVLLDEHTAAELDEENGVSRFFPVFKYQAKAPKKERPVIVREDGTKLQHPTVKPVALMEWLVTLITPPGGVVLDPFAGTGTTLQAARNKGFASIGIERDPEYVQLIRERLRTQPEPEPEQATAAQPVMEPLF